MLVHPVLELHGCVECTPYFDIFDSYPAEDLICNVWSQPSLRFLFFSFLIFAFYPTSTLLLIYLIYLIFYFYFYFIFFIMMQLFKREDQNTIGEIRKIVRCVSLITSIHTQFLSAQTTPSIDPFSRGIWWVTTISNPSTWPDRPSPVCVHRKGESG
ncbi:hypothetical protein BDV27DRAFT_110655 [Aspergillus caelatus]|uniref:Uncharacterized protein n=1 Tax=Aspergillus caelatus TaxID=61420 RepID=A0A5N7A5X1_9EURO|nr:uncharacterized protein BDV27DRAFT_110655 [Aspergillus caelatus]KAE8364828.1 hypothetical protein BDV27DRAFT_110655 [Aspergillus caelatus]